MRRRKTGLALILIAGLLTLLAVVGSAFLRFSLGLREAGGVMLDRTEARLLACSGLQYASARLFQTTDLPKLRTVDNQSDDWTYRDGAGFPLEQSRNPSYAQAEPYVDVDGNGRYDAGVDTVAADFNGNRAFDTWSGRLKSRQGLAGGTFVLKMLGESGKINVNGGWLDAENRNSDYYDPVQKKHYYNTVPDHCDADEIRNRRYVLLLDNLGQIVNVSTTRRKDGAYVNDAYVSNLVRHSPSVNVYGGNVGDPGGNAGTVYAGTSDADLVTGAGSRLGDLLKNRPKGGFQSMGQIQGHLVPGDWEKVKDFLTVTEIERAKFSVLDRTGMRGSSGYVRLLGTESRPLVNLGLAARETLQALVLGLSIEGHPCDPVLTRKTADYLSQRSFASWYDFYLQLHRDTLSVDPHSAAEESSDGGVLGKQYRTIQTWAHVVTGNLFADEIQGYFLEPPYPNPSIPEPDPDTVVISPPRSWHTFDASHPRTVYKMGPSESALAAARQAGIMVTRFEGGRPPLPPPSNQPAGGYLGGTLEASLIPREVSVASIDSLGCFRAGGGRLLASAAAFSRIRFGAIVSARTQEEFENFGGPGELGCCRIVGRPLKDRTQTEPQFSVDSMRDLEAQLPSDRARYSPFWGTIRLADRSGYRWGGVFYVPAWDVDQPLRGVAASNFKDSFQDLSGATDFDYTWDIFVAPFPPEDALDKVGAAFRGDRATSLQCSALPGMAAPGIYTWLTGKKFALDDESGNVARGTLELWSPGWTGMRLKWQGPGNPCLDVGGSFDVSAYGKGHSSRPCDVGEWHHLVVAFDAESMPTMLAYIDGIPDPRLANNDWHAGAINTAYQPTCVTNVKGSNSQFAGAMADEIRLYDRAITQEESAVRSLSSRYWAGEHSPPGDWTQDLKSRLAAVPSFASPLYVFDHPVALEGARWDGFVPRLIREAVDGSGSSGAAPLKVEILCYSDPAGEGKPKAVPFPAESWRAGGGWADFHAMWHSAYGEEPIPHFRAFRYKVWMDCSAIEGFNGETPVFDSISMVFKTGAKLLDTREE